MITLPSMGWLWTRKESAPTELPEWFSEWEHIRVSYPVGRMFEYLGRDMIVTRHIPPIPRFVAPKAFIYIHEQPPAVLTEYADEQGAIREHTFRRESWPILAEMA